MSTEGNESQRRLEQFVDAAFGFSVTLLVIAGASPPETLADLKLALMNIPASGAAFVLIALFWLSHRTYARIADARSGWDIVLNLAVVFAVLAYVYPLRLLTKSAFYWMSGHRLPGSNLITSFEDLATLFQVYGIGFAILSGLYALLFARAVTQAPDKAARENAISWRDPWIICAISGVLSAGVAMTPFHPVPWLPPTVYWLIPVAIWARAAWLGRALRKAQSKAELAEA